MIAVRIYDEEQLMKRLAAYKCRKVKNIDATTELWETGWGSAFTLTNEMGWYDEWQYRRFMTFIAENMPSDWLTNGNSK